MIHAQQRNHKKKYASTNGPHWGVVAWSKLFTATEPSLQLLSGVVDSLPKSTCSCKIDATQYLALHPIDVSNWFDELYRFHAHVDKKKGKITCTRDQARKRWGYVDRPHRAIAAGNWFRDKMPSVCRASFKAAAARWGVEFLELTSPHQPERASGYNEKLWLAEHTKAFDQVLFVDGWDVIIRADCPSLFERVRVCDFGAVPGYQPGHDWRVSINRHLGPMFEASGIEFNADTDHFNSGVLIFSPAVHSLIFDDARRLAASTTDRHWSVFDEGVISLAAIRSGVTIKRLPMEFNRCGGEWKKAPRSSMQSWIQHYCGNHGGRNEIMAEVDYADTSIEVVSADGALTRL